MHQARPEARFCCQPRPPAAGPEAELTFENLEEAEVRSLIERQGLVVLAARTRTAAPEPAR